MQTSAPIPQVYPRIVLAESQETALQGVCHFSADVEFGSAKKLKIRPIPLDFFGFAGETMNEKEEISREILLYVVCQALHIKGKPVPFPLVLRDHGEKRLMSNILVPYQNKRMLAHTGMQPMEWAEFLRAIFVSWHEEVSAWTNFFYPSPERSLFIFTGDPTRDDHLKNARIWGRLVQLYPNPVVEGDRYIYLLRRLHRRNGYEVFVREKYKQQVRAKVNSTGGAYSFAQGAEEGNIASLFHMTEHPAKCKVGEASLVETFQGLLNKVNLKIKKG